MGLTIYEWIGRGASVFEKQKARAVYTLCPPTKKWTTQLMVITLSKPNRFSHFLLLKRGVNCKQNPYDISHHTWSMLLHYLWKVKVQICDKLRTRSTLVDLLWCPSASESLASRISSLSIRGWRSTTAITMTCSCHSSCCPWCATCLEQSTPAFIPPDLWPPNSIDLNPVDYKIWGDVQQQLHQSQLHSIYELKNRLLDTWHSMDQNVIDDAIDGWRKRLNSAYTGKYGHFEQLL